MVSSAINQPQVDRLASLRLERPPSSDEHPATLRASRPTHLGLSKRKRPDSIGLTLCRPGGRNQEVKTVCLAIKGAASTTTELVCRFVSLGSRQVEIELPLEASVWRRPALLLKETSGVEAQIETP